MENITLDTKTMQLAYDQCHTYLGHKGRMMDKSTQIAHEIVLETEWLEKNSNKLSRAFHHFNTSYSKLEKPAFVGLLEGFLPSIAEYTKPLTNFRKAETRYTVSACLIELWSVNGLIKEEVETMKNKRKRTWYHFEGVEQKKDILRGYCSEPGEMIQKTVGHERLNNEMKLLLVGIASMPFVVSDYVTDELFLHGLKLSAEYNSITKNEKLASRRVRLGVDNLKAFQELREMGTYFMPMKFENRGRMGYWANRLQGARPHGKLSETLVHDSGRPTLITNSGADHIKHMIYTILKGKHSLKMALRQWRDEYHDMARDIDPLAVECPKDLYSDATERAYRKAQSEFGERMLLNKLAISLDRYEAGEPCNHIFGKDLTNSGLIMAGNSFRSEKMLKGANCFGELTVADSHTQFGKAHHLDDLPRSEVKEIHTPLLHGSSSGAIVAAINKHSDTALAVENADKLPPSVVFDIQKQMVEQHNIDAYGAEVENISTITEYGKSIVTNHQNIFKWRTPDGFTSSHRAEMHRTPFTVYVASPNVKGPYPKKAFNLMETMPISLDNKGNSCFGAENTTSLSTKGVRISNRGLYANMTHSIDAMLVRRIGWAMLMHQSSFLLKHDDYIISPNHFDEAIDVCQVFFDYLQQDNLYQNFLDQIADKSSAGIPAPTLLVGEAANKTQDSYNFLMV